MVIAQKCTRPKFCNILLWIFLFQAFLLVCVRSHDVVGRVSSSLARVRFTEGSDILIWILSFVCVVSLQSSSSFISLIIIASTTEASGQGRQQLWRPPADPARCPGLTRAVDCGQTTTTKTMTATKTRHRHRAGTLLLYFNLTVDSPWT